MTRGLILQLEAEIAAIAASDIAIAEYRQQCLDNAAEIERLRAESDERLKNTIAQAMEIGRLREQITGLQWTIKGALESVESGMLADAESTLRDATKETP